METRAQEGKVKFAAINCEAYKPLCQRLQVKFYPTLNLFLAQENQVLLPPPPPPPQPPPLLLHIVRAV